MSLCARRLTNLPASTVCHQNCNATDKLKESIRYFNQQGFDVYYTVLIQATSQWLGIKSCKKQKLIFIKIAKETRQNDERSIFLSSSSVGDKTITTPLRLMPDKYEKLGQIGKISPNGNLSITLIFANHSSDPIELHFSSVEVRNRWVSIFQKIKKNQSGALRQKLNTIMNKISHEQDAAGNTTVCTNPSPTKISLFISPQQQIKELQEENQKLIKQVNRLERMVGGLQTCIEGLKAYNQRLQVENDKLKCKKVEMIRSKLTSRDVSLQREHQVIEEVKDQIIESSFIFTGQIETESVRKEVEQKRLQSQMSHLKHKIREIQAKNSIMTAACSDYESQNQNLENEVAQLREKLQNMTERYFDHLHMCRHREEAHEYEAQEQQMSKLNNWLEQSGLLQ